MAPIPTITAAFDTRTFLEPTVEEINTVLHRLGIIHEHPDFGDGDIPGEGGPGGGIGGGGPTSAQRSGILIVLMMFGVLAVMFTVVAGWIWCVAAHEPTYYSVRDGRRGSWKTKRVVPFKEWYRRRRNLPRTKSDVSRENDYLRVLAILSARDWRGPVLSNGDPDFYLQKHWKRSQNTKVWRDGHKGSVAAFNPRSPLMSERGRGYSTFSKEGGARAELSRVDDTTGGLCTTVPYSSLTVPVPPLRRPPLNGPKGRSVSLPSSSNSPEDEKRRWYREQQRSHTWNGNGTGGRGGRPWKCARRGSSDVSESGRRPSWGGRGRGNRSFRGNRASTGTGLDVVVEEVLSATESERLT